MQNVIHPTCPALPAANVTSATEQAATSFGGYLVRQFSNVGSVFQNMSFSTAVLNTCRAGCNVAVNVVSFAQSLLLGKHQHEISNLSPIIALVTNLPVFIPIAQAVYDTEKTRTALDLELLQQNALLQNTILATDVDATEERRELVTKRTQELKSQAEKFKELSERSLFTAANARSFALRNLAPLALLPQIGVPMASAVVVGSAIAHVVGHKVSGWYNRRAVKQINHLVANAQKNLALENMFQTKMIELHNKITNLQSENIKLREKLVNSDIIYDRREQQLIRELDVRFAAQQQQLSLCQEEIQTLKFLLAEKNEQPGAVGGREEEFFEAYDLR